MKSRKIDTYDLKDLQAVQVLSNFLIEIGVKSAEDLYQEVDEIADKEFCGECEQHKDNCECTRDYDYDDSDDRYDAWKDQQLEDEHNQG